MAAMNQSIVDLSQLNLLKIITENNTKILELQSMLVMLIKKKEAGKQEEQRREQMEMRRREYDEK